MAAVPGKQEFVFTVQDATGDVAVVRFPSYNPDISSTPETLSGLYSDASALSAALQSCINGKVVLSGITVHWSRAQKPAGPLGEYPLVQQAAIADFGDGALERTRITLPTVKADIFKADGQTLDDSNTNVAALIAAVEAQCLAPSGNYYNEYLGGRLRSGKPRRRKNLYNGTA